MSLANQQRTEVIYCVKCRTKHVVHLDDTLHVMTNGKKALRGKCPDHGNYCYKIVPMNYVLDK